ncbi:hypothetical protein [Kutzneria kofuensis]|uniref:hypothetical protein n=1 Tax=Kutzneria kofuensis TaxID=103725 RepID=UPI0031ED04D3
MLVSSGGGFEDKIRELAGGEGAHVVYDGGGAPTFARRSCRCAGTACTSTTDRSWAFPR